MNDPRPHSPNCFDEGIGKDIAQSASCSDGRNFCLYVTGIPPDFTLDSLRSLFSECGLVRKLNMLPPKQPGWPKVAFVEFATMPEVLKALELYQCFEIGKFKLRASVAKKRDERRPKGGTDVQPVSESLKDVDLGEYVEKSIEQSLQKAGKRFTKPQRKEEKVDPIPKGKPCIVCGKLCHPTCGQCKSVYYCGSTCQREHWHEHKKVCNLMMEEKLGMKTAFPQSQGSSSENLLVEVDSSLVESVGAHMRSIAKTTSHLTLVDERVKPFTYLATVQPGKTLSAILVDLQPPGIFYFQIIQNDDTVLNELVRAMNETYAGGKGSCVTKVKRSNIYACQFSADQQWYRASVQNETDDLKCKVWYIDFGNSEDVIIKNLRKLEDRFVPIPAHSIKAQLSGSTDFQHSQITSFVTENLKTTNVEIEIYGTKDETVMVEVFADFGKGKASLNEALSNLYGQQKKSGNVSSQVASKSIRAIDQDKQNQPSDQTKNPGLGDAENPVEKPLLTVNSYVNPEKEMTVLRNKIANSALGGKVKGKLSSIFQKRKDMDEMNNRHFGFDIPDISVPSGLLEVIITHIRSVEEIYCSLLGKGHETLQKVQEELSVWCEKNFTPQSFDKDKICATKSTNGLGWYRAEMKNRLSETEISVLFLDYGRTENKKITEICKMPEVEKFWRLERQAVMCKLKGCTTGTDNFNQECLNLLKQCENETVFAEIDPNSDRPYPITIHIDEMSTVNEYIIELKQDFDADEKKSVAMETTKEGEMLQEKGGKCDLQDSLITEPASKEKEFLEKNGEGDVQNLKIETMMIDAIESGSSGEIVITHAEDPGSFTFQLFDSGLVDLSDLSARMLKFYENPDFRNEAFCIIPGNFYAVKYDIDSMWYRAKLEARSDEDKYSVSFIDYGNLETVNEVSIKPLVAEFCSLPIQGINGKLHGCCASNKGEWSKESIATMQSLLNRKLTAAFKDITKQKEVVLDIVIGESQTVSEVLISAGYVAPIENPRSGTDEKENHLHVQISRNGTTATSAKELSSSLPPLVANEKSDTDTPDSISEPSNTPKSTEIFELVSNASTNHESHKVLTEHITTEITFIQKMKPKLEAVLPALVIHVNSPSDFYCQVIHQNMAEIVNILEKLNVQCTESKEEKSSFSLGDCCVACASDGRWYRASILKVDEGKKECQVFYVDYGNEETVAWKQIQNLSREYYSAEAQAVNCSLCECFPPESQWSDQCLGVMKSLVNQECRIVFHKADGEHYMVDLLLGDGIMLSDYLVEQGLAVKGIVKSQEKESRDLQIRPEVEVSENQLVKNIECSKDVPDSSAPKLKEREIIKIQLMKAVSPDMMNVRVMREGQNSFSIRCQMIGIEPVEAGSKWAEEASQTMMMFAAGSLDAKVIQDDHDEHGRIYKLQIPALVNALVLAGQGLHCL